MGEQKPLIRFGVPKGRYNSPGRFNTKLFLEAAGFKLEGYEPGKEGERVVCVNDKEIEPVLIRHEDGPSMLLFRSPLNFEVQLDLAIFGDDWRRNWELSPAVREIYAEEGVQSIPLLVNLNYSRNSVVAAVGQKAFIALDALFQERSLDELLKYYDLQGLPLVCVTKYVNLAAHSIAEALLRVRNGHFLATGQPAEGNTVESAIDKFITVHGRSINAAKLFPLAYIIERHGETEAVVRNGFANLVVDNVATGRTLDAQGLEVLSTLIEDCSASLYGNTTLQKKEGLWRHGDGILYWSAAYEKEKRRLAGGEALVSETRRFLAQRSEKLDYLIGRIRLAANEMEGVEYCIFTLQEPVDGLETALGNFVAAQRLMEGGLRMIDSGKPIAVLARLQTTHHNKDIGFATHVMVCGQAARQDLERMIKQASPSVVFSAYPLSKVSEMSGLWSDWNGESRYPFFSHLFFKEDVFTLMPS